MKHVIISLLSVVCMLPAYAQKQFTKTGHIWFYSEAPLEDIEAHNYQVTSILNTDTGEMVFKVAMNGFQFKKAEMQKHFNEKYVESDKFPEAVFKGKIMNLEKIDFSKEGSYTAIVEGTLTIHNVTKPVKVSGTINVKGGSIHASALFQIAVADYNITIPAAVRDNIAKVIDIHTDISYQPMH